MTPQKLDLNKADFNNFSRFSLVSDGFLVFESGEVCYTRSSPDPEHRRHYAAYGVTVFMPGDSHTPKMFLPTGEPVPAAQLELPQGGRPYLIHDYATDVIKRLDYKWARKDLQVPTPLSGYPVYWAGAGAIPVASPIVVSAANTFTKEERAYVMACGDAAMLTLKLLYSENVLKTEAINKDIYLADIQKALREDISPTAFVMTYLPSKLQELRSGAIAAIQRTPKKYEFLKGTTK